MGITVVDSKGKSQVPFLRGILTRSLQNAGLSFDESYEIASEIRKNLGSNAEVTTEQISDEVIALLKEKHLKEILESYRKPLSAKPPIIVLDRDGHPLPFSKGVLTQSLDICSMSRNETYRVASEIEQVIEAQGTREITSTDLARLTYEHLLKGKSKSIAKRYQVWINFSRSGRPLVLLIGGASGVGKSTISSELAHRLNIVRTQSTDMLREVMRLMISERLVPALHVSSFDAWSTLPTTQDHPVQRSTHFIDGYLTQSRQVAVGIEGVLQRVEREQISIILEGVHLYPDLQKHLATTTESVIVPIILAVLNRNQLVKHLKGRGQQKASRRSERYLEHLHTIWELQSFLLSEADRHQIAIVPNLDEMDTIHVIMDIISEVLAKDYDFSPGMIVT